MFEEPHAKRIRRSEIFSDGDSITEEPQEDPIGTADDDEETETPAYHFDYELIENAGGEPTKFAHLRVHEPAPPPPEAAEQEEAFEFRLFSAPAPSQTQSTQPNPPPSRINIRSPTPDQPSDGRFINPHRPSSYYLAKSPRLDKLAVAAVSGIEILQCSHSPWPGTQMPWRVIHLPSAKVSVSDISSDTKAMLKIRGKGVPSKNARSGKPSKKRRILLRTRARAVDLKIKEKEEHLREKRTRLNREKKVKRKAKGKAEKAKLAGSLLQRGGASAES